MNNSLVYNIPAKLIDAYQGRTLILRSSSASEIVDFLKRVDLATIRFVQLLSTAEDTSILEGVVGEAIPIEILLKNPADQYQHLYNYSSLLDSHPVRVAIPVVPGFSKAVKLAVSLNFAVKLELSQPDEKLMKEVEDVLDLYLHRSFVRQPIEFFHSLLLSIYNEDPVSLWELAEEDPGIVRYVTDDGEEIISRRFAGEKLSVNLEDFVSRYTEELISEKRECHDCEFLSRCGGYFKWPDRTYRCDGVKQLFRTMTNATLEVQRDLAGFEAMGVQAES